MSDRARPSAIETGRELETVLGHRFADCGLLVEALTHPSLEPADGRDYERLEFLGDRVLGLVIATSLIASLPAARAGDLAVALNALVRRETVAEVARELGLGPHLRLGPSETAAGGGDKPAILANALEGVLGALYLDGGLAAAAGCIERAWGGRLAAAAGTAKDAKTRLQERLQIRGGALPVYAVLGQSGPAHRPRFRVMVEAQGQRAEGEGGSRRTAEQAAATALLAALEAGGL